MVLAASRIDPKADFVVPERFSVGKRNLMAALGAEIVNTPAGEGMGNVIDHTREMADSRANAVVLRQFVIPPNAEAHYEDDRTGGTRRAGRRGGRGRDGLWNRGEADRGRPRTPRAGPGRSRRRRRV